jgi:glycosyltransferase involved in cell wall biosynthesis
VRDGETGILVKPDNVTEHGSALATLLNDPVTARAMGLRGKEHACERYDLDRYVRRMITLHEQALGV